MFRWRGAGRLVLAAGVLAVVASGPARAQHITIDGSLSPAQTLIGPNYTIGANLGRQVGGNLFHSFGLFGLSQGETANFTGPATVSNIIGRVTGGMQSSIDGTIKSSIAGANLYLINPAGIVFGPNAAVDVSGSFRAAAADYLRLSDGAKFQATTPGGSTLTAAAPAAFGFLNAAPPAITVDGSALSVPTGQTLGLAGGAVNITGATLQAPAGAIRLTAVSGAGEVPAAPGNGPPTVAAYGPIAIAGGSTLDVSDPVDFNSGGSVRIRAGTLTVDASTIGADNDGAGNGGALVLRADSQITLSGGSSVHAFALGGGNGPDLVLSTGSAGAVTVDSATVETASATPGQSGNIAIRTGQLSVTDGAVIASFALAGGNAGTIDATAGSIAVTNAGEIGTLTLGFGNGGDVSLTASGALTIDSALSPSPASTVVFTATLGSGGGIAGNIQISAGSLNIVNGGLLGGASFFGAGQNGNIAVSVGGAAVIDGGTAAGTGQTGILSTTIQGAAAVGNITFHAGTLELANGGQIGADTFGPGNAGNIAVLVDSTLTIDGSSAAGATTGITSNAQFASTGNAGAISVSAASVSVKGGGVISSQALVGSAGNAGTISVSAGALNLATGGSISTSTASVGNAGGIILAIGGAATIDGAGSADGSTGIASLTSGSGNAGSIALSAGSLSIRSGGEVSTDTSGSGNAGTIGIDLTGALTIAGTGSPDIVTGIESNADPGSTGAAGQIEIIAASASLGAAGTVATATSGPGGGGDISVAVAGDLTLDGNSGIPSGTTSTGNAGRVSVSADTLSLTNLGTITSNTTGAGNGGSVSIAVTGLLSIDGQRGGSKSGIGSQAQPGSTGNAGQVVISAGALSLTNGGVISTATFAPGAAGNIAVSVAGAVTMDGAGVFSNTIGANSGDAGQVTLKAASLAMTDDAAISTSTGGAGTGGAVTVEIAAALSLGSRSIITSNANPRSTGNAGRVAVTAGSLALSGVGQIATNTFGAGNGGNVTVDVLGALTIDGRDLTVPSGILSHAGVGSTGNAGDVTVTAGSASMADGGAISTSTFGPGDGGNVSVNVFGALALSGFETVINSNANKGATGNAGTVAIAAGNLSVADGAVISTLTAGPGAGGNIGISVVGGVVLEGAGPQINAASSGTGNAGSITISAADLELLDGASISTAAASANGGDITLHIADLLYLLSSRITTSVDGALGNGGNIAIDPVFVVLNHSDIIANAVGGNGGNITIDAGAFVASADSVVSASSQLGISGTIDIAGQETGLDNSLVPLSAALRAAPAVSRDKCAAREGLGRSTLVDAGRGGLPLDPDAALPALYLAGRGFDGVRPPPGAAGALPPGFATAAMHLAGGCEL